MGRDDLPLFSGILGSSEDVGVAPKKEEPKKAAEPAPKPAKPQKEEPKKDEPKHLTVTELTSRIKGILEPAFDEIWVQGEVSNYRPAASGHLYFSLKDAGSMISCAQFNRGGKKLTFEPKDGLQVLVRGKVSVYAPRGNYQLIVDRIEPMGAGALQVAFEQLKAKLAAEGLFDAKRKRPLPAFPKRIAVVTSPSGAAIRDMLNILRRRAPHIEVLVIPALVQGDAACAQIQRGLEAANRLKLGDLVVLARGGGSIEDMWCFNDESLARAIAASELPVVSAVGHEIDFTIADFVADLRAPTPSAAAEIVSGHWVDVARQIQLSSDRMRSTILRDLANRRNLLGHLAARVVSPLDRLREQMQRVDEWSLRLERGMRQTVERRKLAFGQVTGKLEALSPLKVLERGYSIAKDETGKVLRSRRDAKPGEAFSVVFTDGEARAKFT
jgi:exodeoxyribonuclease VII large subunit